MLCGQKPESIWVVLSVKINPVRVYPLYSEWKQSASGKGEFCLCIWSLKAKTIAYFHATTVNTFMFRPLNVRTGCLPWRGDSLPGKKTIFRRSRMFQISALEKVVCRAVPTYCRFKCACFYRYAGVSQGRSGYNELLWLFKNYDICISSALSAWSQFWKGLSNFGVYCQF